MSAVTSAQLVAGVVTTIKPPNPAMSTAAVVIQNLSSFDVTVINAGQDSSLAPYTQDVYATETAGTPIQLAPVDNSNAPAGIPAYVVATWYGPDETPDAGAGYPSTVSPPAYALGVAIAEQLLATGIPSVLQETVVDNGAVKLNSGDTRSYDVHSYATLLINIGTTTTPPAAGATLNFFDSLGHFVWGGAIGAQQSARVAVIAHTLQITADAGAGVFPYITGSNRPVPTNNVIDLRSTNQIVDSYTIAAPALGNNDMAQFLAGVQVQGLVWASAAITNNTIKGRFELKSYGGIPGTPTNLPIIDTTQMPVDTTGGQLGSVLCAIPAGAYSLVFNCSVAAAGTCRIKLVQA